MVILIDFRSEQARISGRQPTEGVGRREAEGQLSGKKLMSVSGAKVPTCPNSLMSAFGPRPLPDQRPQ
jgi:hypothetical protein